MHIDSATLHHVAYDLWRRRVPVLPRLIDAVIFLVFHASLPHTTRVGHGTVLAHHGLGVLLHPNARIGRDVWIGPHVVLGMRGNELDGPTIEDGAAIGACALVLGGVTVGANAVVGAGAVVLKDVPADATVVGNPARVVHIGPGARPIVR